MWMHNLNGLQMKVAGDGNINLVFGKLLIGDEK
jgi:hypothetical protein